MITRDTMQGFIDGHKLSHKPECLETCIKKWLMGHKRYPQTDEESERIMTDLSSYE